MSDEKVIGYFRFNRRDQLLNPDNAEVYTPVETKLVWRSRATGNVYPAPPWDRETEHLKNVAKRIGLGTYKVISPEQRVAIKESLAEFDRANRVTREEVNEMIWKAITEEIDWGCRVMITKDGIQKIGH